MASLDISQTAKYDYFQGYSLMEIALSWLCFGSEYTVLWGHGIFLHTKFSLNSGGGGEVRKAEPTIQPASLQDCFSRPNII